MVKIYKAQCIKQTMNLKKCPQCGSFNLVPEIGGATGLWRCKNCGYVGSFFVEQTVDEKMLKKTKFVKK